jgi:4-amino-4-deoxy-L-arabinose transferase-like glycosyltransferase
MARNGRFPQNLWLFLGILLFATMVRWQTFGDPFIGYDEQFYLLVGDRMWYHGALPFVDIFDRKPIGLFLIYAAVRALGGQGLLQYQLVALLCVAATALLVARFARKIAGGIAPVTAACLYVIWLKLHGMRRWPGAGIL